jgi:SAM-dependent methyltransferase
LEKKMTQEQFYDQHTGGSLTNRIWQHIRHRWQGPDSPMRRYSEKRYFQLLGDISDKKVLEFGVGTNSPFSHHLAVTAKEYWAVNISKKTLDLFCDNLKKKSGQKPHKVIYGDIMNIDLPLHSFDVVVGLGVVHHLADQSEVATRINHILRCGGYAIFWDPMNTELFIRLLRLGTGLFRPNLEWEFPFLESDLDIYKKRFPKNQMVFLGGLTKICLLTMLLPVSINNKIFTYLNNFDQHFSKKNRFFRNQAWQVIMRLNKN